MNTRRRPVGSTAIKSIGYSRRTKVLVVEFKSGAVYHYQKVSRYRYDQLRRAESKGSWVATTLVAHPFKYPVEKVR